MYVYLPVQFIFSFCSNYCLLTFCIFLNIFLDLLYILCHAVFLAIKTNKKKKVMTSFNLEAGVKGQIENLEKIPRQ